MKNNLITFIIPVRHFLNAKDWGQIEKNLSSTALSLENQTSDNWRCVIVANKGSSIPNFSDKFSIVWVDFEPNPFFDKDSHSIEKVHDFVRLDKGKRVLAGMKSQLESKYYMIVDDDDFVNKDLVSFVEANPGQNGWFINKGYVWKENSNFVYKCFFFDQLCGTSLIVKNELYEPASLDFDKDQNDIKQRLGSHVMLKQLLAESGQNLLPLPFFGATYRIGNINAHSRSTNIFSTFILPNIKQGRYLQALRALSCIRYCTDKIRYSFRLGRKKIRSDEKSD